MKIKVIHLSKILLFLTLLVTLLTVGISIVIATSEDYIEVPIIMYHSILKDSSRSNKYTVTPAVLEEDLKYIKDKGIEDKVEILKQMERLYRAFREKMCGLPMIIKHRPL